MFLNKKNTPKVYHGMFYAGLLNLAVSYFNLYLYYVNGSALSLLACILSLVVCVVVLTYIKRQAQQMLWEKLQQPSRTGMDDGLTGDGTFY